MAKQKNPKGIQVFEKVFGVEITYFENQATFEQKVLIKGTLEKIAATVEFMVCNDSNCLPPTEEDLVFHIKKKE